MTVQQIRREILRIRQHKQVKEPSWKKNSEEILKLLKEYSELLERISRAEIEEAKREVLEDYKDGKI